jgi:uncharacterized Zn finger protein (UPF0148 family)
MTGRTTTCPHCGKTFERQPKSADLHYARDQKRKHRASKSFRDKQNALRRRWYAKKSGKGKLRGLRNQSKWRWPVSANDLSE